MMDNERVGIDYFLSNPKGHLLECHVKKVFPELYEDIMKYDGTKFSERVYRYYHNLTETPVCEVCGKPTKFRSFTVGYPTTCSIECSGKSQSRLDKIKATTLERYGVENASQSQAIKQKKLSTLHEHYGHDVNSPLQSQEVQEKMRQTNMERYGVENVSQSQEIQEKVRQTNMERYGVGCTLQSPEVQEKVRQTNMERYGVENVSQSQEIQEKVRQTNMERYGVGNVFQNEHIKEKIRQTNMERYGVEHPLQSPIIMERTKRRNMEKYGVENVFNIPDVRDKAIQTVLNNTQERHDDILNITRESGIVYYTCQCPHPKCSKCTERSYTIPATIYNTRRFQKAEMCTNLLPIQYDRISNTTIEQFVRNILDEYNIEYTANDRSVLNGKELDIYIPSYNLAIECNGIYWHSLKEPDYHYNKWKSCYGWGIQLLTLWEDQIINKPDIIRNIILSRLGIYEHRIGANKCTVKEVPTCDAREFLDKYHLQGNVAGSVRLGLYYNDELISIMVFGRSRNALGNKKHDKWELYRYCVKGGWQVIGGAARLFKHFTSQHAGCIVESFSSNDISIGDLYKHLGFDLASIQKGSYWYVDKNMVRHHRYSYRKDRLVSMGYDPSKTEFQITDEMGLMRIYDSGQMKWVKNT